MRTVKPVVLLLVLSSTGCDQLFGVQRIADSQFDAPAFFEYDGAPGVDTAGWPTNGMVTPTPCLADSTADEDADGRRDECDNCPLDPNDQMDVDQDGIGDLCDPHPLYAVERLAVFNGFNGPVAEAGTAQAGTWNVTAGILVPGATGGRTLFVLEGGPWREPKIHVRFGNVRRATLSGAFSAGIYLVPETSVGNTPDGIECRVLYTSGSSLQMIRRQDNLNGANAVAVIPRVTDKVTMVLGAEQFAAPPHCDGSREAVPATELEAHVLLPPDAVDPMPPRWGLLTSNARADFEAFVIYETTYP